jgi:hypothetical protein
MFSTNVATHTDFDKGLVNERFKIKEHKWFKFWKLPNFYKKQKLEHKKIDYSKNKIIGEFK